MTTAEMITAAATAAALVTVAQGVRGTVRTGLGVWGMLPWGRRRRRACALRRLDVGQTLNAFTRALGEPDRLISDALGRRLVYEDRNATVTALVNDDDVVIAYHVRTGSRRFHPRITLVAPPSVPSLQFILGRTSFADTGDPTEMTGWLGASRWDYRELHYLGNPGRYLYYLLTHDMGSPVATPSALFDALRDESLAPAPSVAASPAVITDVVANARAVTPITGYGVLDHVVFDAWQSM